MISSVTFSRNCIIIEKGNPSDGWEEKTLRSDDYPHAWYLDPKHEDRDEFKAQKSKRFPGIPE
jgi:hypothetical protein